MIFTGTGRCGTGYVAVLLSEAGYPCEHESFYSLENHHRGLSLWTKHSGESYLHEGDVHESSWLALPAICSGYGIEDTNIVHVTREPYQVAKSIARTRVMEDLGHGYGKAHATMCPLLHSTQSPLARGWIWIGWVYGVLQNVPQWDVSEPVAKLAELGGFDAARLEAAAERVPRDVNTRPGRKLPEWWATPSKSST